VDNVSGGEDCFGKYFDSTCEDCMRCSAKDACSKGTAAFVTNVSDSLVTKQKEVPNIMVEETKTAASATTEVVDEKDPIAVKALEICKKTGIRYNTIGGGVIRWLIQGEGQLTVDEIIAKLAEAHPGKEAKNIRTRFYETVAKVRETLGADAVVREDKKWFMKLA